jgi:DNA-binding winged helix-turn-helix (wHTH) protein
MTRAGFRFDRFRLDPADRRLTRDGRPVEISARYLDALALLVREAGRLVSKDRFMDEVWRGVPVTDEALTQCVRTLRRALGDDAASPRFIETVPKHGYRFIAPVEPAGDRDPLSAGKGLTGNWRRVGALALAGTVGGAGAGALGGLFYGFAAASQPLQPGMGAVSVLLVVVCITTLIATIGAAGVASGIAAIGFAGARPAQWSVAGGALGGLAVGTVVKLLGLDAFNLLLGHSPGDITGPFEGVLLGAAVGLAAWLGLRGGASSPRRRVAHAALIGGAAGVLIPLLGGRLMGGSLDLLASSFPASRLRLDQIGRMLGESGFGPLSQIVTGALEGGLFAACVVGAMTIASRGMSSGVGARPGGGVALGPAVR